MSLRNKVEKRDIFTSEVDIHDMDNSVYGAIAPELDTGRITIKPVDIMDIWPDLAQPRRAIPLAVRGQWHGNPLHVIEVLDTWQRMAESAAGITLDTVSILQGRGEGFDTPENPVAESYIDLLRLAASIFKDGLTNAITIAPGKDKFLIETGERRWLAHHLLYHHVDDKFGKILAREVQRDVWRQATENNQRRKLNAIEMARQLALLVMDMYEGDRNTSFDSLEMMMRDGCDRYFYAQVAQGRLWKVKDGFAERVQAAMGLTSYRMVAAYRNILRLTDDDKLNDEIWIRADMENWSEGRIRNYVDDLVKPTESLPIGKHGDENTSSATGNKTGGSLPVGKHATPSAVDFAIGQRVIIDGNPQFKGVVSRKSMNGYTVNLMGGGSRWFESSRLTPVAKFADNLAQPRSAATPTIEGEGGAPDNESDGGNQGDSDEWAEGEDYEPDAIEDTPKPIDTQAAVQKLADLAMSLDLEEAPLIEDLVNLTTERIRAIVTDFGIEVLERHADTYRKTVSNVLIKIQQHMDAEWDAALAYARQYIAEKAED